MIRRILLLVLLIGHTYFLTTVFINSKALFYEYSGVKSEISNSEFVKHLSNDQLMKIQNHFDANIVYTNVFEMFFIGEMIIAAVFFVVLIIEIIRNFKRALNRGSKTS